MLMLWRMSDADEGGLNGRFVLADVSASQIHSSIDGDPTCFDKPWPSSILMIGLGGLRSPVVWQCADGLVKVRHPVT